MPEPIDSEQIEARLDSVIDRLCDPHLMPEQRARLEKDKAELLELVRGTDE
jgi:hypothetical protein